MTDLIPPPPPPTMTPPVPPVADPGVAPPPSVPPRGLNNRAIFVIWFFVSGIVALPFAWYSTRITRGAKIAWSAATAVQATILTLYVISLVGGGGVAAGTVASQIQQQLPAQMQQALSSNGITDATVTNPSVTCSSTGADQYTCTATYDVTSPSQNADNQQFTLTLAATIDASHTMRWHATGPATPT